MPLFEGKENCFIRNIGTRRYSTSCARARSYCFFGLWLDRIHLIICSRGSHRTTQISFWWLYVFFLLFFRRVAGIILKSLRNVPRLTFAVSSCPCSQAMKFRHFPRRARSSAVRVSDVIRCISACRASWLSSTVSGFDIVPPCIKIAE